MTGDISPDFQWNKKDWQTIQKVLPHEATQEAVRAFARYAYRLSDYAYWFLLSTLWVSYTGWSDLELLEAPLCFLSGEPGHKHHETERVGRVPLPG